MRSRTLVFAAALWWGSLSAIGLMAVPLLFRYLPTAALAGQTAARLFSAQTWVSLVCGALLRGKSLRAQIKAVELRCSSPP